MIAAGMKIASCALHATCYHFYRHQSGQTSIARQGGHEIGSDIGSDKVGCAAEFMPLRHSLRNMSF